MTAPGAAAASDVLVVIIEAHSRAWASLRAAHTVKQDALDIKQYILQVCTFLTAYQILNDGNRLAVLASLDGSVQCLFSDLDVLLEPEAPRNATAAATQVASGLREAVEGSTANGAAAGPGTSQHSGQMSAALSQAMCMFSRASLAGVQRSRLLVVQCARDVAGQYIGCMNAIFSAQRLNVVVDAVCPTLDNSSFVEQAAHMTGGVYLRVRTPSAMLQHLLTCFDCNLDTRELLEQPTSKGLNFKATCFCHARVIDVGYVCSACLSVFCGPQRVCITCGSEFGQTGGTARLTAVGSASAGAG